MSSAGKVWLSILLSCLLTGLWAKATAVYNWGNIGGRVDPYFEHWYRAGGPLELLSIVAWLSSIVLAVILTKTSTSRARWALVICSLAAAPATLSVCDWLLYRDFPRLSG